MREKGLAPILIVLILAALVGGYFVYQNQAKPTPSPQPATQSSPSPADPIANWKTYTNEEGRYSIKYPPNLVIDEAKDYGPTFYVSFNFPDNSPNLYLSPTNIYISFTKIPPNITMKEAIKYPQLSHYKEEDIKQFQKIIIDGVEGLANEFLSDFNGYDIFTIRESKIYMFRLSGRSTPPEWSKEKQIFDQILSTFKFTN